MNIIFFTHPSFMNSQSMPRFAQYLGDGMQARGHRVVQWTPIAKAYNLTERSILKKWLGYIDQYVLFPWEVRRKIKACSIDTLFVFTDQALGPWVHLVAKRPHVIHCHDFMAQRSALGEITQNATSWTGRQYQAFIRQGYTKGKHFISVSETTQQDLHRFLPDKPVHSYVVYNGLNQDIVPVDPTVARFVLGSQVGIDLASGYLLHVGGNQWYKNREGVIELYDAWRASEGSNLPLLLVGESPTSELRGLRDRSAFKENIHFLTGLADELVRLAYSGATVFLFPSLAEGFGWPIAEAMAAGCPVITTQEAPMTEVGEGAAFYIPRRPTTDAATWAIAAVPTLQHVVSLGVSERKVAVEAGLANARRFEPGAALNQIEAIYQQVLKTFNH